jgi:hypothetical protein
VQTVSRGVLIGNVHQKKVLSTQKNNPADIILVLQGSTGAIHPNPAIANITQAKTTKIRCNGATFFSLMVAPLYPTSSPSMEDNFAVAPVAFCPMLGYIFLTLPLTWAFCAGDPYWLTLASAFLAWLASAMG